MKNDLASQRQPAAGRDYRSLILPGLIVAVLLYLGGWWIYQNYLKSDEAKIRDLIAAAKEGIEARNPSNVSVILSESFTFYGIGKEQIHQALIHVLMTQGYREFEVAIEPAEIPVLVNKERKTASAEFRMKVRARYGPDDDWTDIRPPQQQGTLLKCSFKLGEDGWKMDGCLVTE